MKKLFMFLAVAGLATFGASCSSDDSKGGDDVKQLTISSDAKDNTVEEGTSVKFTAKVDGKEEAGAAFYVDGTKVANPYKFDKKGTYKVVAKKDKLKESEALTITVKEAGNPPVEKRTLVLTATPSEVTKGENVTFTVKDDKGAAVAGAVIKKADGTVVTSPWKSDVVGTIKFTATKADYNDSNVESVVVKEAPVVEGNYMKVDGVSYEIDETQTSFIVNTIKQDGKNYIALYKQTIDGQDIYYAIFTMEVATADFAASENTVTAGALSKFTKYVIQDIDAEGVVFPGENPELEANVGGWIAAANGEVNFANADIAIFTANELSEDGGETRISASNQDGNLEYDGEYAGLYINDTTNSNAGIKAVKSLKKSNTVLLTSLKKLVVK